MSDEGIQPQNPIVEPQTAAARPTRDPRFEIASTIWLAMVNDELPDDSTLDLEGYLDAADALLAGTLFDAFVAGWKTSAEGCNGEYGGRVDETDDEQIRAHLRSYFDRWLA